jgi:hypothetical protein
MQALWGPRTAFAGGVDTDHLRIIGGEGVGAHLDVEKGLREVFVADGTPDLLNEAELQRHIGLGGKLAWHKLAQRGTGRGLTFRRFSLLGLSKSAAPRTL